MADTQLHPETVTDTNYLDHLIRERTSDGWITIYQPNGAVLLSGRINTDLARSIVRNSMGAYPGRLPR